MQPDIIRPCTDAAHINAIINHPEVYPHIRGNLDAKCDITTVLDNPNWVALFGEHGGFVFMRHQLGLWEIHSQCLPEGRGRWMLEAVHAAFKWMFIRSDAIEIVTRIPFGNIGAKALAKRAGMKAEYALEHGWIKDGEPIAAGIYSATLQDWLCTTPTLEKASTPDGLAAAVVNPGLGQLMRPDVGVRDRYVGAACEMIQAGNVLKGVSVYNRFAVMTGCHVMTLLSPTPVVIGLGTSIMQVSGNKIAVEAAKVKH